MKKLSSKLIKSTAILCMFAVLFTGCGPAEEDSRSITIVKESVENSYEFTHLEKRDVIKTESVSCTYSQLMQEDLAFPVSDKTVAYVYVNEGDEVKVGDLVAKLDVESLESDNVQMREQLERNDLLMAQADEMIAFYEKKIETPGISLSSKESYLSKLQKLREKRRTYSDENDFNRIKISANEQQIEAGSLYAGMDGNISFIKDNLEGNTSRAGETVITILNASVCGFQAMDRKAVEYVKLGDRVQIVTSLVGDVYDATVTSIDVDKSKIVFELDQPDYSITVGTRGTVNIVQGEADGVLSLPKSCVFEGDDFWFTYVLNGSVKEMRKIDIGLIGNDYVEVTGGISADDVVILRKS